MGGAPGPDRRAAAAVCCAALLVLAGCNVFGGAQRRGSPTVTPAPVPEQTTRGTPTVAPGIGEGTVVDAARLARAHGRALANQSFTVEYRRTVRAPNGTVRSRTLRVGEFARGFRAYRTVVLETAGGSLVRRSDLYFDGTRATRRVATPAATAVRVVLDARGYGAPPDDPREALPFNPYLLRRVAVVFSTVRVREVEPGREFMNQLARAQVYQVAGRGADRPARLATRPADAVAGVQLSALVGRDGFVRRYGLRYRVRRNGTTAVVTEQVRFTRVGATFVTPLDPSANATADVRLGESRSAGEYRIYAAWLRGEGANGTDTPGYGELRTG